MLRSSSRDEEHSRLLLLKSYTTSNTPPIKTLRANQLIVKVACREVPAEVLPVVVDPPLPPDPSLEELAAAAIAVAGTNPPPKLHTIVDELGEASSPGKSAIVSEPLVG